MGVIDVEDMTCRTSGLDLPHQARATDDVDESTERPCATFGIELFYY